MKGIHLIKRGFTLIELLVVLVIIALLATAAVPVYLNSVLRAQVSTAKQEARTLGMGMDAVAAVHGLYVPLQVLDDLAEPSAGASNRLSDDLEQERLLVDPFVVNPFIPLEDQVSSQDTLSTGLPGGFLFNPLVFNMIEHWQGPFVNFNRFFKGIDENSRTNTSIFQSSDLEVHLDFVLDPWQNPYRLYSPIGITGQNPFENTPNNWDRNTFNLDLPNVGGLSETDPFDRWAVVSFGPNQRNDNPNQTSAGDSDDIIYFFGGVINESGFNF